MFARHFRHWPNRLPKSLVVPDTGLYHNLEVSAFRYPEKTAMYYYGSDIRYREFLEAVDHLAGFMQHERGVTAGDRVLLFMQNSPQFMIAYYAIIRVNAVVVPINPMLVTDELGFYIDDSEPKLAIVGQELYDRIAPFNRKTSLEHVLVAAYADYTDRQTDLELPDSVKENPKTLADPHVTRWREALALNLPPDPVSFDPDAPVVLPYTSGTTGRPKGCIHTSKTVQANTVGGAAWGNMTASGVNLTTLPLFHVTGMVHGMHIPIFSGSTMVVMTRWKREVAAQLIERCQCTHWTNISTMLVDFLAMPDVTKYDLSSLTYVGGGGAPVPRAIGEKLIERTGVRYVEGYGLSETMAQTHFNPPDSPKLQCLGIPSFGVDARIVDLETLEERGAGEEGEIVVHGPQVFKGYWNRREETEQAFITLEGKLFLRTGDIGRYDEDGYFFIVDRAKRMINASGYKVWPTEVESILYQHPKVQSACVVGAPDPRRGETVKAYVVLHEKDRGHVSEEEIMEWSKGRMAAYKHPRRVEFVDRLPMTATGKVLWRQLQEKEWEGAKQR
ncbi:long-chain fatty acid--CoA ligase [Paludifilum halophilum]|uniref:Long-chain fatty acid--CoA ligase n=1 Tax=Paludifilum halophilum TaxID=1642702 RepID=A0A235B2E4_9BACL|nr:long-chain fatty acid--CoA ligase [Paludifilum halophilum]OYD06476.1 long-chain fatty acid--CoA ligase [Paludifilum halophilum]